MEKQNSQSKNKIFILSGPSGVGKSTVSDHIILDQDLNLKLSISYTTRPKRSGEIEGDQYHFVSEAKFEKMIQNKEMIEYIKFIGNYYGTSKKDCLAILEAGHNLFFEIDVDGCNAIQKNMTNTVSIFLMPPSTEELVLRIRRRGTESHEIVEKRLLKAEEEMKIANLYDYQVVNHSIKQSVQQIKEIILQNLA